MVSIGEFAQLGGVSPRTLRHYGDLGLVVPASVDPSTGYRSYELAQLSDLRRVLALRDLGVPLDQIGELLKTGEVSIEQMRGMLRLRRAEISAAIEEQQGQLRRVASYLDALERGELMPTLDVVTKTVDPVRVAETVAVAPGHGYANIHPIFEQRLPAVWTRLVEAGVEPGVCVACFEWPDDEGRIVVHLGFEIGDQALADGDDVRVVELPACEVASAIHRGSLTDFGQTFEATVRWIDGNGYRLGDPSRERYLEAHPDDPTRNITELQIPIVRSPSARSGS